VGEEPAHGHYLAAEVGLLAGVSGDRVGQWARWGHIRSSRSAGDPRVYSYEDVAEALIVHELEELGATLRSIRRAVDRLREREHVAWPLQHNAQRLGAANGTVVEFEDDQAYDLGGPSVDEQGVLEVADLRRIHGCLERGGWAARVHPELRHVEVHPERLSGRPVIRGRRVAAQEVAELAGDRALLREDYDLTDEQIDDAVLWWETVGGFES
jgi:uncharacterized protein (DUF433 family)